MVSYQQKITLKGSEASIDYFTDLLKEVKDENGSNTATVLYEAMEHWEVAATASVENTAGNRSGLIRSFQLPLLCCGDRHSKVNIGLEKLKNDPILRTMLTRAQVGRSEYLLEAFIVVLEKFRDGGRGTAKEILVTDTGLRCAIDTGRKKPRDDMEPSIIRRNSSKEATLGDADLATNDSSTKRRQQQLTWRQRLAREQTAPPAAKTGWRARMEEREGYKVEEIVNSSWRVRLEAREASKMGNKICKMEEREHSDLKVRMKETENITVDEGEITKWRSRMEKRKNNRMVGLENHGRTEILEGKVNSEDGQGKTVEVKNDVKNNRFHWSKYLIPVEDTKCKTVTSSMTDGQMPEEHNVQSKDKYSSSGSTSQGYCNDQSSLNLMEISPSCAKRKLSTTKEEKKAQENIPKPKKRSTIRDKYDLSNIPQQTQEDRKKMASRLENYMWVITPDERSVPGFKDRMTKHERHRLGIDCDEVFPGIILGNGATVKKKDYLQNIGISHILNAAESRGVNVNKEYFQKDSPSMEYMGLRVEDTPQTQICRYFLPVAEYLDEALLSDGRVFVNCVFGKSRSTTCVAVYLMIKHGWDALKALSHIRQTRPVQVNSGFLQQLADLDYKLQWLRKGIKDKNETQVIDVNENNMENVGKDDLKLKTNKKYETHKLEKVFFEIVEESICTPEKITTQKKISIKENH